MKRKIDMKSVAFYFYSEKEASLFVDLLKQTISNKIYSTTDEEAGIKVEIFCDPSLSIPEMIKIISTVIKKIEKNLSENQELSFSCIAFFSC